MPATLLEVDQSLTGLLTGQSSLSSSLTAAVSMMIVLLLLWAYDLAQIFLLDAEFTWFFARARGSKRGLVKPMRHQHSLFKLLRSAQSDARFQNRSCTAK